ncbi:hypothetical protein SKAU_G00178560 [Synaphobranchus kaupii]|uniref:Uncharacterized protein n=1 Tax=Synaphobranchus kaupii TaxID=118154 RepID=A0A9Q1FM06_SYNKA|nr:hypothetical protein SKAU_G00178560 [Synaphobranchus kaupii]
MTKESAFHIRHPRLAFPSPPIPQVWSAPHCRIDRGQRQPSAKVTAAIGPERFPHRFLGNHKRDTRPPGVKPARAGLWLGELCLSDYTTPAGGPGATDEAGVTDRLEAEKGPLAVPARNSKFRLFFESFLNFVPVSQVNPILCRQGSEAQIQFRVRLRD